MSIIKDILSGVFRFIHITSGCFIIGNSVSDIIWGGRSEEIYQMAYLTFILALMVSGVINIILMNPSSIMIPKDKALWNIFMYCKAALWILFIPIPDLITKAKGHNFPRKELNAALVLAILILSIIAKTVRDWKTRKLE